MEYKEESQHPSDILRRALGCVKDKVEIEQTAEIKITGACPVRTVFDDALKIGISPHRLCLAAGVGRHFCNEYRKGTPRISCPPLVLTRLLNALAVVSEALMLGSAEVYPRYKPLLEGASHAAR